MGLHFFTCVSSIPVDSTIVLHKELTELIAEYNKRAKRRELISSCFDIRGTDVELSERTKSCVEKEILMAEQAERQDEEDERNYHLQTKRIDEEERRRRERPRYRDDSYRDDSYRDDSRRRERPRYRDDSYRDDSRRRSYRDDSDRDYSPRRDRDYSPRRDRDYSPRRDRDRSPRRRDEL
jgi:hypothetical protein